MEKDNLKISNRNRRGQHLKFFKLAVFCMPLVLGACGTKRAVVGDKTKTTDGVTSATQLETANRGQKNETVEKLTFVQKVSDTQVYAKNITGGMDFSITLGSKDISVAGSLKMRKNEVIRIQLQAPVLGFEVGRLEFTPKYVLIVDRIHKEYIKADYNQVDFLQKQGINFYSLQALFWNQLLLPGTQKVSEPDLKKFEADLTVAGVLVPVTFKQGNMTYTWKANRSNGRIYQADVNYRTGSSNSTLHIDYSNFKSVGVKFFPATQKLTLKTNATQKQQELHVGISMNEVKTDANWDAETQVPSKYKQVAPEDVLNKIMDM